MPGLCVGDCEARADWCPEAVIAKLGWDAGRAVRGPIIRLCVRLRQHRAGKLAGAATDCAEQRPVGIVAQDSAVEIGRRYSSRL